MGRAAALMMGSVLLSRILGYARDAVIAWQHGATPETDAYFVAFTIPDFLNYLLAGEDGMIVPAEAEGLKIVSIGFLLEDDSPVIWRGPMPQDVFPEDAMPFTSRVDRFCGGALHCLRL